MKKRANQSPEPTRVNAGLRMKPCGRVAHLKRYAENTMPNNFDCEAWVDRRWELLSIEEAKARGKVPVRCPECKGQIKLHAGEKITPHAEHVDRFAGCSRGDCFDGNPRLNPFPLEIDGEDTISGIRITEEIGAGQKYSEGAVTQVIVNRYERDPRARRACIEHYGAECQICSFKFEEEYGTQFSGFIHVHHIKELSSIRKEYVLDPIKDLIPVCPNCHAIIHRRTPPYTVQEMQEIKRSSRH